MPCQLARNAMHDTPIVEDDKVALFPTMCVDIFRGIDPALKAVADTPNLVKVVDLCNNASLGVTSP